ncbi:MAG: class I SAM-dependent methyltransferase [Chloroflexota bacterium]
MVEKLVVDLSPGYQVLEVGCGTGNVLRILEKVCVNGVVTGLDKSDYGFEYAQGRTSCRLIQGDISSVALETELDVVGLFDVLEHVTDDSETLRRLHTTLKPGGRLVLTVPACPSLWSYFDEASHHVRRYSQSGLHTKLLDAGFEIEYLSYYMATIFPLMWLGRRVASLLMSRKSDDVRSVRGYTRELRIVPVLNSALKLVLAWERYVIARGAHLPFGTSLIAVARKAV